MNPIIKFIFGILFVLQMTACEKNESNNEPKEIDYYFDFSKGNEGWQVGYSDYPSGLSLADSLSLYEFLYGNYPLPPTTLSSKTALRVRGQNRSDDLLMFIKKKITGLTPNKKYFVFYKVKLASQYAAGGFGSGGAPCESVYLKAGAKAIEPTNIIDSNKYYRINWDIGSQANSGIDAEIIGNVCNQTELNQFALFSLASNDFPLTITTDNSGSFWAFLGTDSAFEGLTDLYYSEISVYIIPDGYNF